MSCRNIPFLLSVSTIILYSHCLCAYVHVGQYLVFITLKACQLTRLYRFCLITFRNTKKKLSHNPDMVQI